MTFVVQHCNWMIVWWIRCTVCIRKQAARACTHTDGLSMETILFHINWRLRLCVHAQVFRLATSTAIGQRNVNWATARLMCTENKCTSAILLSSLNLFIYSSWSERWTWNTSNTKRQRQQQQQQYQNHLNSISFRWKRRYSSIIIMATINNRQRYAINDEIGPI